MFKKVRTYFVLCAVAILSVLALTACGDDDNEPGNGGENGIVGEWRPFSQKGWEKADGTIIDSWDESRDDSDVIWEFSKDGTLYCWGDDDNVETSSYSYSGNKLTIKFIDENGELETQVGNCKITGNTLKIEYSEKEVVDGHSYEYYNEMILKRITK